MTRFLLVVLAALLVGCDDGYSVRAKELSTEPTVWKGSEGTAVTIRFATDTKRLEGARVVGFKMVCPDKGDGRGFWSISGFTVPVMKLEPRAVTVFVSNTHSASPSVLGCLPQVTMDGTLRVWGDARDL